MINSKQYQRGFTLIELMIVVAIVAILAAVAVPSYQQFVQDGRRAECKAFAYEIASRQEEYLNDQGSYASLDADNNPLRLANGNQSENGFCSATVVGGATYTMTITMTPADTECSPLTLNNTGLRGLSGGLGDVAQCWR